MQRGVGYVAPVNVVHAGGGGGVCIPFRVGTQQLEIMRVQRSIAVQYIDGGYADLVRRRRSVPWRPEAFRITELSDVFRSQIRESVDGVGDVC